MWLIRAPCSRFWLSTRDIIRGSRHVSKSSNSFTELRLSMQCPSCLKPLKLNPAVRRFSLYSVQQIKRSSLFSKVAPLSRLFQPLRQTTNAASVGSVGAEIPRHAEKIVGAWLLGCAGMCFGAVVLGGITRLTESGLSMVDWRLLKDMRPPRSEKEWEEEFERYKTFPEYKYVSGQREMTLSDFKFIYYMEYIHRMWGRTLGMFFILPAAYFLKKKWITKAMKPRLAIYAAFIAFQGFMGWYMVKSGLQENPNSHDIPRVSQYRLAVHLGSAVLLYTLFLYAGLTHLVKPVPVPNTKQFAKLRGFSHGVMTLIFLTVLSGAFVAGLDAGLVYNSWPKMADKWIPDDIAAITPKWKNVFENPTTVQFNHRHLAESTVLIIAGFWWICQKSPLPPRARLAANCLLGMALLQTTLGITTLLTYVPTSLAASHQSGALLLLSMAVWLTHEIRRLPK